MTSNLDSLHPVHVRFVATLEAHYNFIGIWLAETTVEVILALYRCLSFVSPNIIQHVFCLAPPRRRLAIEPGFGWFHQCFGA